MELTDAAAVGRARSGDGEAFRLLVERHSRAIFRVAWRMMGNEHDADDVVQETFLRAWRQIDAFEDRASFSTWLNRIAMNCAVDLLRARRRVDIHAVDADTMTSSDPQQEQLLLSTEMKEQLTKAMEQLTPQERTAFVMRHFDGLGINEIGQALGIKRSATKHSIFRAVQKLRASLESLVRPADACDGRTARSAHLR